MVLSDNTIQTLIESPRSDLSIDPYLQQNVEPASVDLRLSDSFANIDTVVSSDGVIDTATDNSVTYNHFTTDSIVLEPGSTVLGSTIEQITLPDNISARVVGRSSLGRLFVEVHKTAGFCDPGFSGDITLEIGNDSEHPVRLHAGHRICQIVFERLDRPADRPYGHAGSQYQDQDGATKSGMNFE